MPLLDDCLPRYDVNEVHDIWIEASHETAFRAVKEVTVAEVRLLVPLMALRGLPRLFVRRRGFRPQRSAPVVDEFLKVGFVMLGERPGSEVALGAVGRFWSVSRNEPAPSVRTRDDFVSFAEPGYAKAAMSFVVRPDRDGSRVTTETRVAGTSADATRAFRRYWRLIRPGSGAIRRSWLAAIRRRALRGA